MLNLPRPPRGQQFAGVLCSRRGPVLCLRNMDWRWSRTSGCLLAIWTSNVSRSRFVWGFAVRATAARQPLASTRFASTVSISGAKSAPVILPLNQRRTRTKRGRVERSFRLRKALRLRAPGRPSPRSLCPLAEAGRTSCGNPSRNESGGHAIVVALSFVETWKSALDASTYDAKSVLANRTYLPELHGCWIVRKRTNRYHFRAKLDKYPDGYPGDADPPPDPLPRVWKKQRLRVRYFCHQCSTQYVPGERTCATCGEPKGSDTIRDPYVPSRF
jgi:hypothetical protein